GSTMADLLETPGDSHSGELETSIMLHLAPELVKGRSPRETPKFPAPIMVRRKTAYWPGGVNGNPEAASEYKGAELFQRGKRALIELVKKVAVFEEAETD
ncbi:MAG: creatininase family protein, partial [Pseudomonadota bacterium]